ncbi:hypothetical protein [Helicobacter mustelae]|nr:hypothetical protein [Helicobacter mustelae]SQH72185.1 Uncharacterised protein [Helicobacter mustelae]
MLFLLFSLGIAGHFLYFHDAFLRYQELMAREKSLHHLPKLTDLAPMTPPVSLHAGVVKKEGDTFEFSGVASLDSFMHWLYELEQNSSLFIWDVSLFPHSGGVRYSMSLQQKPSLSKNRQIKPLAFQDALFFTTPRLVLRMILNHRAKINQKWYAQGEDIQGFLIQKITTHSLVLQDPQGFVFSLRF